MENRSTSLEMKRKSLINNGIIKADPVQNIEFQKNQPHGFAFNLCGHCTFHCSYCPQSKGKYPAEYIEHSIVERLLTDVKNTPSYFQFGTRGENLLHPQFFEIIKSIKQNNHNHYITLNTNGLLMKGDFALNVLRSGIDQLIFSLQSIKPEIYTSLTNNPNFDMIISNIKETIAQRNDNKINVLIGIQFLNTLENRPYYGEFEDYWKDYDVYLYSQTLHGWGDKFDFQLEAPEVRYPCLYLWLYPNISHKGNVCSCFADFYDENVFGNLSQKTLHEIWTTSPLRRQMIEDQLNSRWDKHRLCEKCNGWMEFPNIFKQSGSHFEIPGSNS